VSPTSERVRLLIADDHPVVRQGLRAMLDNEADLEVVGEAGSGREVVAMAGTLEPDVVLMDLRMPDGDGVEATTEIGRRYPSVRVLIVTTYETDADILRAVEAGATGYVLKDTPLPELVNAIRSAARGETVLAPSVAARLMRRMRSPSPLSLTARELEVLQCVARGLTNADIGRELFIGEATVKTHLLRSFAKLGVDDRTAAVTVAIEQGLLPAPGR
jgi:DNA-binding NarL/FixJ family response regulator